MSTHYAALSSFELSDGRILDCRWNYYVTAATWEDPSEREDSNPTYWLEGKIVNLRELPKGLDVIADKMYNDPDSFHYEEEVRSKHYDWAE